MWKVSKYGVFTGPYFPVFGQNTGKYGPEKNSVFEHIPVNNGIYENLKFVLKTSQIWF